MNNFKITFLDRFVHSWCTNGVIGKLCLLLVPLVSTAGLAIIGLLLISVAIHNPPVVIAGMIFVGLFLVIMGFVYGLQLLSESRTKLRFDGFKTYRSFQHPNRK